MTRYYFDHNATTPVSQEALEVFAEVSRSGYGNASSIHREGQQARGILDAARSKVAALLGCAAKEIVFTSGGTEAGNLAIFGAVRGKSGARHVITTTIEHPAVLSACRQLEREGVAVTYVNCGPGGAVDPEDVRRALRPETALVSIMHVNNETGIVQPVPEIAAIARAAGALMHSDGVQAAGRMAVDVAGLGVDLYSLSAHKMYAPKGVGALYVRRGTELAPQLHGGRHESGRRAGTENVAGAAALGAAAGSAIQDVPAEAERIGALRARFENAALREVPDCAINGSGERSSNTVSLCVRGIEGEALVIALDLRGFAISSGSACSSGAVEPSHVLLAMGLGREDARSSVRVSLGRSNTGEQVDALVEAMAEAASQLRRVSTAYA